jgi:hypothetical protein
VRALLSILFVLALPLAAAAQGTATAEIAQVREQILYASYPDAIAAAQGALARTDLSAADRNTLLELLATAQIANRQTDDARATLTTLFARDPGHRLTDPDASPPVVSAFARAREARPTPVSVTLEHDSPGTLATRESPVIVVELGGAADAVHEVVLSYRHAGEPGYTRVVMNRRADGAWTGRIPVVGSASEAIDVAYFLTASAPSGTELGHRGSEAEPLDLRIPADAAGVATTGPTGPVVASGGGDVASEPWFWILIGTVAVGAGVGIGLGVGLSNQGPESGTLGVVMLEHF